VLIVRVEASLLYFNVNHVRDQVRRHLATAGPQLRVLVWDLSTSPYVDIAGARLLGETQRTLAALGVAMRIVEARAPVRDIIRKEIGMSVGQVSRRISIDDAIAEAATPSVDLRGKPEAPIDERQRNL
jgi:sulfate permease, SulP family